MRVASLLVLLIMVECGSTVSGDDSGTDAHTQDGSAQDVVDGQAVDAFDVDAWHVVDGGGSCAPDAGAKALSSCCNGQACEGVCIADADGDVACYCAGVVGGCSGGLVCCSLPNACVSADKCGFKM